MSVAAISTISLVPSEVVIEQNSLLYLKMIGSHVNFSAIKVWSRVASIFNKMQVMFLMAEK
jgi:hypothetical protein